jgi:hypothetical protein
LQILFEAWAFSPQYQLSIGRIFKHFKAQCDRMVAKGLASLITRASLSLAAKIVIKIPAITYHRLLLPIVLVLDSFNHIRRLPDK